jgi:hydroxylamine reductase (hybrid-cluster protein)
MSKHDDATRAKAMAAMRTSAKRTKDEEPNFLRLSTELNIARRALVAWWREAGGTATPHRKAARAPKPAADPTAPTTTAAQLEWAAKQLGLEDLAHRDVELIAELRAERDNATTSRDRQEGNRLMVRTLEAKQRPPVEARGPATPEEWVALVVQMPEVLLEAWMSSSELWADERWTATQARERREGR